MRPFILFIGGLLLTFKISAQRQVTISLITDPGVKHSDNLHFYIANGQSTTHNFTYDQFSKTGEYPNLNLFQYNENIDTGHFKFEAILKTATTKTVVDSLVIDNTTERVEIFVYVGVKDAISDYIKEIKTLKYKSHSNPLQFNFIDKPKIGSKAVFRITNSSDLTLFGYPNNAFFFGTLYKEIDKDSWIQHYPLYIDIKYCDTVSNPRPLIKNETVTSWVPKDEDCSEYKFEEKGNYYFELLFSDKSAPDRLIQGETELKKQNIFRQILEFKL
jgi:hypothetical protein